MKDRKSGGEGRRREKRKIRWGRTPHGVLRRPFTQDIIFYARTWAEWKRHGVPTCLKTSRAAVLAIVVAHTTRNKQSWTYVCMWRERKELYRRFSTFSILWSNRMSLFPDVVWFLPSLIIYSLHAPLLLAFFSSGSPLLACKRAPRSRNVLANCGMSLGWSDLMKTICN